MKFVKTRSGRFLSVLHMISLSVEETKIEIDGKKRLVYKLIAHMSQPLLPAVLGIYSTEDKAYTVLEDIVKRLSGNEKIVGVESEF
ncbi:MAG: hypothetical protein ACK4SM_03260 [Aquificaceae bacterium]